MTLQEKIEEILRNFAFDDEYEAGWVELNAQRLLTLFETELEERKRRVVKKCYGIFLQSIKEAKDKFPNRSEFELVVDVRDIEKTLKFLTKNNTQNEQ